MFGRKEFKMKYWMFKKFHMRTYRCYFRKFIACEINYKYYLLLVCSPIIFVK